MNHLDSAASRDVAQAAPRWGATPVDWQRAVAAGLVADLLPVVSNPNATIAPTSSLKALGKVPSRYTNGRQVVGIAEWTRMHATEGQVRVWSAEPDYGICVQTRNLRAIDIDISDERTVKTVLAIVEESIPGAARRVRPNAAKCLVPVRVAGPLLKRRLIPPGELGAVELLADGQQFVAVGTHPSGVRYGWTTADGGLPDAFPILEPEELEALWLRLRDVLGATDSRSRPTAERGPAPTQAAIDAAIRADPVAQYLYDHGLVLSVGRDGQLFVDCPNREEHTTESGPTSTCYYPAGSNGYAEGRWHCLHAHCAGKATAWMTDRLIPIEFEDLSDAQRAIERAQRFRPVTPSRFVATFTVDRWLVKGVLPAGGAAAIYGPSGAGKSFAVLDLAAAVAQGIPWRGHRTTRGRVVYVVAEGRGGFGRRLCAYAQHHGVDLDGLGIELIGATPNLVAGDDRKLLVAAIGRADLVVLDTQAAMAPGIDENSSEIGKFLAAAEAVRDASGATTLVVHHAGKDAERGQRGWSGLKAPLDVELAVERNGDDPVRVLRLTKCRDSDHEGAVYPFRLAPVVLGEDADGDPVRSAVVVPADPPAGSVHARPAVRLGRVDRAVRDAAAELFDAEGIEEAALIEVEALLDAAVERMTIDHGARDANGNPKRDRRREVAHRSLGKLIDTGVLAKVGSTIGRGEGWT